MLKRSGEEIIVLDSRTKTSRSDVDEDFCVVYIPSSSPVGAGRRRENLRNVFSPDPLVAGISAPEMSWRGFLL